MFNWLYKSLCRECHQRKRNVINGWCPECLTERDKHIGLYIDAMLACGNARTEEDVEDLVTTAVRDLRALPPGGVVLALRDVIWQVRQQR